MTPESCDKAVTLNSKLGVWSLCHWMLFSAPHGMLATLRSYHIGHGPHSSLNLPMAALCGALFGFCLSVSFLFFSFPFFSSFLSFFHRVSCSPSS